jgi:hypothetical protein
MRRLRIIFGPVAAKGRDMRGRRTRCTRMARHELVPCSAAEPSVWFRSKRQGVEMSDAGGGGTSGSGGARLPGRWRRAEHDVDDFFPESIEFREGTYLAQKGRGQRFIEWDAGTYELDCQPASEGEGLLTLSTATDSLETYPVKFSGESFEVFLKDGRRLRYDRDD